jgi:hypothetical protein
MNELSKIFVSNRIITTAFSLKLVQFLSAILESVLYGQRSDGVSRRALTLILTGIYVLLFAKSFCVIAVRRSPKGKITSILSILLFVLATVVSSFAVGF